MDANHFWKALDLVEQEVKGKNKPKFDLKSAENKDLQDQAVGQTVTAILGTSAAAGYQSTRGMGATHGESVDGIELVDREKQSIFDDNRSIGELIGSNEMDGLETRQGDVLDKPACAENDEANLGEATAGEVSIVDVVVTNNNRVQKS